MGLPGDEAGGAVRRKPGGGAGRCRQSRLVLGAEVVQGDHKRQSALIGMACRFCPKGTVREPVYRTTPR